MCGWKQLQGTFKPPCAAQRLQGSPWGHHTPGPGFAPSSLGSGEIGCWVARGKVEQTIISPNPRVCIGSQQDEKALMVGLRERNFSSWLEEFKFQEEIYTPDIIVTLIEQF